MLTPPKDILSLIDAALIDISVNRTETESVRHLLFKVRKEIILLRHQIDAMSNARETSPEMLALKDKGLAMAKIWNRNNTKQTPTWVEGKDE